jgi:hypothetical protein
LAKKIVTSIVQLGSCRMHREVELDPKFGLQLSRRTLLLQASAVSLAALAAPDSAKAQQQGAIMPLKYKLEFGAKTFKIYPKASIVSYPILFMRSATAKAGTLGIYLEMEGPTEADMRALATEAHDDLSRQLVAAGYQMISGVEAFAHPDIAKLGKVPGNGKWASGIPDPYGQRGWYITSAEQAPLFTNLGSFNLSFESGLPWALRHASRELGAMLVMPRLVFDFSTLGGASRSGSAGSTSWVGGSIQFMVKATSIGYAWAGGPRPVEIATSAFYPSNRDATSPWPLLGNVSTVNRPLPPAAGNSNRARYDVFQVDINNWREQVRAAYRGYHKAMIDFIVAAKNK